ncbi:cobyrinic acid a,c-diamide synthase [Desulfosarcina alkanivorans]|uniref:Cobyrinate a,c-diamide synthase n=1 Tax=Desulfosarcina alkanivorans TaxID=571177 RepID=A0A5K7YPC2_9BACT|nr:cobyrinate a,c-diamide synthase [Desulfosarcina alkanivorans]BBO70243.1 cobyrinic acid a,c-diamide synthase [Desulfosarcina alkanivorans]
MKQVPSNQQPQPTPGIVVAALRGGSGKTIFSVGIIAALRCLGRSIAPFKKGPDYIDAGWLALAAGRPCYNLDTFLIDRDTILGSYHTHTRDSDFTVIEGNRGLYDCIDTKGETSTAELAKLLGLPVILCIDATKTTRTMAAVVGGIAAFDPQVAIGGVVLNRVAGKRHQSILTRSIEEYTGIPVLGAVPKLREQRFPERHMGLVPTPEHSWAQPAVDAIRMVAEKHLDLERIQAIGAMAKPPERGTGEKADPPAAISVADRPTIGILRDAAFQFYYPENLEALEAAGARIVYISPLTAPHLPPVDALYIGGGFPETHARELASNTSFREELQVLAGNGLPIYAECGGLMYLGEALHLEDGEFQMAGVLPAVFGFSKRPQGHGYTIVRVDKPNPFYAPGSTLLGHEFHYSSVIEWKGHRDNLAFSMERGSGFLDGRDGVCVNNVLATYTHIHALGTTAWARALVRGARKYHQKLF